jgi:hypothetical protein
MNLKRTKTYIVLLMLILGSTLAQGEIKNDKLHKLNRDILLLNLINGLYLTPEQMESLIDIIDEAEKVREDFEKDVERNEGFAENVLEEVREVLVNAGEIPDDLKKRVHKMKEIQHRLEDERGVRLIRLESEVEALLTQNQMLTIEEYKPCTIPPAQGKIGQSVETAAEGLARMLTRIRRMPRDRYEMTKDMFVDFHLDKIERHLGFKSADEKKRYRQDMLDAFEKARTLSDQEFLVQKGDMAQGLMPQDMRTHNRRKNQLTKVGHFLLDPALKPILEKRLRQG